MTASMLTDTNAVLCPVCNGQMWDNRKDKKNPKSPDFKCKDRSCKGVIWPPKPKASMPKFLANQEEEDRAELAGKIGPPDKPKLTAIYLDATKFVLEKIVPLYEEKEIGLTDTAIVAAVATLYISASRER